MFISANLKKNSKKKKRLITSNNNKNQLGCGDQDGGSPCESSTCPALSTSRFYYLSLLFSNMTLPPTPLSSSF